MSSISTRPPAVADHAAIAHLTAALGIEGRLVDDDLDLFALARARAAGAADQQRAHPGAAAQLGVAPERAAQVGREPSVDLRDARVAAALPGRARPLALGLHRRVKPVLVERHAAAAQDVLGQVEREAEGVVEAERGLAREPLLAAPAGRRELVLEQREPLRERLEEAALLALDPVEDVGAPLAELGVGAAHGVDRRVGDLEQERALDPEQHAMPRGAPQDPAQHVAAPLVRRQHAVADQEGHRARVIRDDVQRDVLLGVPAAHDARDLLRAREDPGEQVAVVVRRHALDHGGEPLQPGAGVDRGLRQRRHAARRRRGRTA